MAHCCSSRIVVTEELAALPSHADFNFRSRGESYRELLHIGCMKGLVELCRRLEGMPCDMPRRKMKTQFLLSKRPWGEPEVPRAQRMHLNLRRPAVIQRQGMQQACRAIERYTAQQREIVAGLQQAEVILDR